MKNIRGNFWSLVSMSILLVLMSCGGGSSGGGSGSSGGGDSVGTKEVGNPSIVIVSPSGTEGYTTSGATTTISGYVEDDTSVSGVTWTNDGGGGSSGTATVSSNEFTAADVSLAEGDNNFTFTATDAGANTSQADILIVRNVSGFGFTSTPQLKNTSGTAQDYVFKSTATYLTVTIGVAPSSTVDSSSMALYKVESDGSLTSLASMADDGTVDSNGGDDIANDNVYSTKYEFNESSTGTVTLRIAATSGGSSVRSETFALYVLDNLTASEYSAITTLPASAEAKYDADRAAGMSAADAKSALVAWLLTQDGVYTAGESNGGNGVWWVYDSGVLGGLYLEEGESTARGGGFAKSAGIVSHLNITPKAADDTVTVGNTRAKLLAPFYTQFEGWGGDETDEIKTTLEASSCPKYDVDGTFQDATATVEEFKDLDEYGVVVITSHGDSWYNGLFNGWDNQFGDDLGFFEDWLSQVIVLTATVLTDDNRDTYEGDIRRRRLAVANGNYLAITPRFIQHYNNGMQQAVVYIGSCRSNYNNTMVDAFRAAGARTIFGYTDYVDSLFAYNHGMAIFTDMVDNAKETGDVAGVGDVEVDADPATFTRTGETNVSLIVSGIVNGGFEDGSTNGWAGTGDARVISSLGTLDVQEGSYMGIISTGLGSVGDYDSYITQSFCVPADATSLSFRYEFVSEEPMCWVGQYNDQFEAHLRDENGDTIAALATESVDSSSWNFLGPSYFSGGDTYSGSSPTCEGTYHDGTFHTGWDSVSYDVSAYAGTATPVTLYFHVWDASDSIWDTAALIDDIELQ